MVKIAFPNPNDYGGNLKAFLRQLELSVHHAQKAYDQLISDKMIPATDDDGVSWCTFRFPEINLNDRERDEQGFVKVHVDEESDSMQKIELEIRPD